MATIEKAIRDKVLEYYVLPDHEVQAPLRDLLVSGDFMQWLDDASELMESVGNGRDHYDNAEQGLSDVRCSKHPVANGIQNIKPQTDHVWEYKAATVRLFGFMCDSETMIIVCGSLRSVTDYTQQREFVKKFIKDHQLEGCVWKGRIEDAFQKRD